MTTSSPDHVLVPRANPKGSVGLGRRKHPGKLIMAKDDEQREWEAIKFWFRTGDVWTADDESGWEWDHSIEWFEMPNFVTAATSPPTSGGVNAGLLEAAKSIKTIIRPWLDGISGTKSPKISGDEWIAAVDKLFDAISTAESAQAATAGDGHDAGHPHLIDGEFQSDKYPTTPRGKVPLSVKDKSAQDLLWTFAQRRRVVDNEFGDDLEIALKNVGFVPPDTAGDEKK